MAGEEGILKDVHVLIDGNEWPQLINVSTSDEAMTLSLSIAEDISWFEGHFPNQAVLPGVVQIHWATKLSVLLVSYLQDTPPRFKAVNNVKFKTMILPGQNIDLNLRFNKEKSAVKFSYCSDDNELSTGTIVFTTS